MATKQSKARGTKALQPGIAIYKAQDGRRFMFIVTSNSYKDRDDETIKTKALQEYVDSAWVVSDKCLPENPLFFWHDDKAPIGDIIWTDMEGPFLLEVAKERRNAPIVLTGEQSTYQTTVKALWDAIERNPKIRWGASHGFKFPPSALKEGVYSRIKKFETSVLPLKAAANPYTFAGVIDMADKDKVLDSLAETPGLAKLFRKNIRNVKRALDEAGIEHKEKDVTAVKGIIDDLDAAIAEFAAKISEGDAEALTSQLRTAILAALTSGAAVETPEEDVMTEEMEADAVTETPPAEDLTPVMEKQLNLFDRLITSQEKLTEDSAETMGAIKTVADAIKPLADVPKSVKAMEKRIKALEDRLSGKPRRASIDDSTVVEDEGLTAKAKEQLEAFEELIPGSGIKIKAAKRNGSNGSGGYHGA